jgi:hypothetical protein
MVISKDMRGKFFSGALVVDDSIKPQDKNSRRIREKLDNQLKSVLKNYLSTEGMEPVVVVKTKIYEDDHFKS